ncbi:Hypothetical protein P9515_13831 [Prochlorococcus marinus str. MIT 9515]|uniref:Glycosyltransferase 2-like domain-containing protein n=1 Tax=Prochlorococcus marinus (strain MIT 9515) TaxID=167542 RepID=A2BXS9_PROM5|nr:glycosyltransferase family 2 protein [Prochlorococcus marinus]ABM72590.1 Hypothetical protein P9515_13831 [Prochlorococcus marinus str. MIT 9515]
MENIYPKISVVIPSFNQGSFIEETILSIINQKYPNLELIIIDALSTDSTLKIIKKYFNKINYFVSEKDNGQAHALNKGFKMASGQICSYLNSDDTYIDNILWKIAEQYKKNKFKWIYTDVLFGNSIKNSTYFERRISSFEEFCAIQTIAQQGVFWENNSLKKPWFDENLMYVMDHKFFINLYKNFGKPNYLNITGAFFRIHGNSKTSKFEKILFDERKKIGLEYAELSDNKYQKNKIKLEIKRLDLKIKMHKTYSDMLACKKLTIKIKFFLEMLIIFIKSPFKKRDLFFFGYLKKSIKLLVM